MQVYINGELVSSSSHQWEQAVASGEVATEALPLMMGGVRKGRMQLIKGSPSANSFNYEGVSLEQLKQLVQKGWVYNS